MGLVNEKYRKIYIYTIHMVTARTDLVIGTLICNFPWVVNSPIRQLTNIEMIGIIRCLHAQRPPQQ